MKVAWIWRMASLGLYIIAGAANIMAPETEKFLSTFELSLLAFLILGLGSISAAVEETKED